MSMKQLEQALRNANAQRYLRMIAAAEGTLNHKGGDPYRVAFGGGTFDDMSRHPEKLFDFKQTDGRANKTSAHGAYQFIAPTWKRLQARLQLPDFGPRSQDLAALELIREAGALNDVLAGNFDGAVKKTGAIWASLPSSPHAQPRRSQAFINQALGMKPTTAQATNKPGSKLPPIDLSKVVWKDGTPFDPTGVKWADKPPLKAQAQPKQAEQKGGKVPPIDFSKVVWKDGTPFDPTGVKWADGPPQTNKPAQAQPEQPKKDLPAAIQKLAALGAGVSKGGGEIITGAQHYLGAGLKKLGMSQTGQQMQDTAARWKKNIQTDTKPVREMAPVAGGAGEMLGNMIATAPLGGLFGKGAGLLSKVAPGMQPLGVALSSGGAAPNLSLGTKAAAGAITGAANAALMDTENPLGAAAAGATLGAFAPVAMRGVERVISPNASRNQSLKLLRQEGVHPTIGQALGGNWARAEEKAMSVPVVGDAIRAAHNRAQDQFNKAAINRALRPIGEATGMIGYEGIDDAAIKLGGAYDELLSRMKFSVDSQLADDLARVRAKGAYLSPDNARVLNKLVDEEIIGRLGQKGGVSGEAFKQAESNLSRLASEYSGSAVANERQLGHLLNEALDSMRSGLSRSNPKHATRLSDINHGWAHYVRLRDAASRIGAKDGTFSAAQLHSAVRSADGSVGKGSFARGHALMQDLTNAGKSVLTGTVPNSGTTDRALLGAATLGGSYFLSPPTLAGIAAGTAAYSSPAQRLLVSAVADRPAQAKTIAELFGRKSSVLSRAAVPLVLQDRD